METVGRSPDLRQVGEIIEKKYKVLQAPVGEGGLSRVYRVKSLVTGQTLALKEYYYNYSIPHDRAVALNIRNEAEAMKSLRILEIPYLRDLIMKPDRNIIVMDYIEGKSLNEVLRKNGPMSVSEVREIAVRLCNILIKLHEREPHYVYRDLKPANIMLMPDNSVKLIDLGTLKRYEEGLTKDKVRMGTETYASPEQIGILKNRQSDSRSDIYTLGVTIFELLTGTDLNKIRRNSQSLIIYQEHIRGEVEDCLRNAEKKAFERGAGLAGLLRIAQICMQYHPEDRFLTVREVKHALIHHKELSSSYHRVRRAKTVLLGISAVSLASCLALFSALQFGHISYHLGTKAALSVSIIAWFVGLVSAIIIRRKMGIHWLGSREYRKRISI